MGFFEFLFKKEQTREFALALGFEVAEIPREVPYFSRDGDKIDKLKIEKTVRYSLRRSVNSHDACIWKLLQRTQFEGAQLPNDYLLEIEGEMPQSLRDSLTKVAEEYDEEYFEFEADENNIYVFWEEWGGDRQCQRLYKTLVILSKL